MRDVAERNEMNRKNLTHSIFRLMKFIGTEVEERTPDYCYIILFLIVVLCHRSGPARASSLNQCRYVGGTVVRRRPRYVMEITHGETCEAIFFPPLIKTIYTDRMRRKKYAVRTEMNWTIAPYVRTIGWRPPPPQRAMRSTVLPITNRSSVLGSWHMLPARRRRLLLLRRPSNNHIMASITMNNMPNARILICREWRRATAMPCQYNH